MNTEPIQPDSTSLERLRAGDRWREEQESSSAVSNLLAATKKLREQEAQADPAWVLEEEARIASESWRHTSEAVHREIKKALVEAFGVGTHLCDVDEGLIEEIIYDVIRRDDSDSHVTAIRRRIAADITRTWAGRSLTARAC